MRKLIWNIYTTHLPISVFHFFQMKEMREQIENDGKVQEEPQLNELQSQEILLGLQSGVDVSVYADARYTCRQMEQIRIMPVSYTHRKLK